jgi:siroheme synthase-like protein
VTREDASGPTPPPGPAGTGRPATGYPVVLDVTGRRCLVVGGGPVAARRARALAAAGARVTVVAPRTVTAIDDDPALAVERRPYRRGEAAGFHLVVTATGDPEVDRAVAAAERVGSADQAVPGTIQLPAVHRDGPVTVAVSTGGTSPGLARWLRTRIASTLPAGTGVLADLLEEARREMQAAGRPTDSVDWQQVLDDQLVPLIEAGRVDEAREVLRRL